MIDILILPTAGFDRKTGLPIKNGLCRINTAIRLIQQGEVKAVAILGGKRVKGPGEADLYMNYIRHNFYEVIDKINWIVDASATFINRDLPAGLPPMFVERVIIKNNKEVGITSYKEHMERAAITLQSMGIRNISFHNSGEPKAYSPLMEKGLTALTMIDPKWSWFPPCLLLVRLANRRLNETLIKESPS